jgi:hypothetical protein
VLLVDPVGSVLEGRVERRVVGQGVRQRTEEHVGHRRGDRVVAVAVQFDVRRGECGRRRNLAAHGDVDRLLVALL